MEALPRTIIREVPVKLKPILQPRITNFQKKHLQQKFLLCGFVLHAFLATPVYLYGILVDSSRIEKIARLWPAILYQAFTEFSRTFLQESKIRFNGNFHERQSRNRKIILFATLIVVSALTICGIMFSSAWVTSTTTTEIVAISIYGLFGGVGSNVILSIAHSIIENIRPDEDKYVRKTIHLCGEAFCQLFLSFVMTSLRTLYGPALALVLMGSLLLNVIPLSLLITKKYINEQQQQIIHRNSIQFIQQQLLQQQQQIQQQNAIKEESSRYDSLPGFSKISDKQNDFESDDEGIEMQQKNWKNPNDGLYNYMAVVPEEGYVAYINPNGVEIMEIIPEEDENISTMRSSCVTMDNNSHLGIDNSYNKIQKNNDGQIDNYNKDDLDTTNFERFQKFSRHCGNQLLDIITVKIWNPFRRAIIITQLYPATFVQSSDIFSYAMCLTVLPDVAICQHHLKFAEIPFLFSLLAFPWMCFALMTPRFGNTLIKRKIKWHIFGCTAKAVALIFISISSSKLLLSVATVLLGFGQAVIHFLQDVILKTGISNEKWMKIEHPMHFTNGLLIIVWGSIAQYIIKNDYGFQAAVAFVAGLYFLSILIWYIIFTLRYIFRED